MSVTASFALVCLFAINLQDVHKQNLFYQHCALHISCIKLGTLDACQKLWQKAHVNNIHRIMFPLM